MILWCSKCGEDREASTVGPLVCSWCFGPLTPRDWPAFWQSLTPQECAEALRAAPRVAGEWVGFGDQWSRSDFRDGSRCVAKVWATWYGPDQFAWSAVHGGDRNQADTPAAAKLAADAALVAAGWVLL